MGQQTYVKLLWRLAQRGVVLLDKVPANLVLGEIIARGASGSGVSRNRGCCVLLTSTLVLLLLGEGAVGRHGARRDAE